MRIFKYLLSLLLLIGCLAGSKTVFGQTPTFANLTGGLTGSITSGDQQKAVLGFSVSVTGGSGSLTFTTFTFNASSSPVDQFLTNGTLYRCPSGTYSASPSNVAIGNVTFSGLNVTITDLSETVSSTTNYFLVADAINSSANYEQLVVNYNNTFATDINGNTYPAHFNANQGYNYGAGTPYPVSVSNTNVGVTASGTILSSGQTNLPLFGFKLTTTSASTFGNLRINSSVANIGNYFTNFKLYSNSSNTYVGSTQVTGLTASTSGGYVIFSTAGSTLSGSTTAKYYFLVANCSVTGSLPVDVQFYLTTGQTSVALTRLTPGAGSYNNFTVKGNTFNINSASVAITSQQNGVSGGTITVQQANAVLFGFGITASSAITVSGFNINSSNANTDDYFGNGRLYRSPTNTYNSGTAVLVGTATFNGNYATVTGLSESISASAKYYFLVADDIGGAASTTVTFNFTSGQSQDAVIQSSPQVSSYNTFNITGNTFTMPSPTIFVTSANNPVTNGITAGNISFGQTGIVLFGFSVQPFGSTMNITKFNIKSSGNENNIFSNGKLYRSTSPTFPGGTPLYTGITFPGGGTVIVNVTESVPSGTTYYYFFTADYTGTSPGVATISFSFANGQSPAAIVAGSSYNTYNITGTTFNIASAENWVGTTSSDFSVATNYKTPNGGSGFTPTSTTVVNIGVIAFTNQPSITTGNFTVDKLNFGTTGTPTLTVGTGRTLTVNSALVVSNSNATITGSGTTPTVTLPSTATSSIAASGKLTINGTLVMNNAGTFSVASTGVINVSGTSTLANTNSFTLESDASGTGTFGPIAGTVTGTYKVERFMTGGGNLTYRGYRLLSSAVSGPSSTAFYNMSFLTGGASATTGAANGGFDFTGNPTIYLYREDKLPSGSSFTSGNYRAVTKINNSTLYSIGTIDGDFSLPIGNGFLYFYRGNSGNVSTTPPNNVTFTQSGTLNKGQIIVKPWFTGLSNLSSTTTSGTATVKGFNLVGNPYPSSIDWETYHTNAPNTTGIYAPTVGSSIYVLDPVSKNYGVYTKGGNGVGTNGATNIVASGQGFFVKVSTNPSTAGQLYFNESAKSNTQVTGANLLLGTPVADAVDQYLRLKFSKDSVSTDEILVRFNSDASVDYIDNEDAQYQKGLGAVSLLSVSKNNVPLAINILPFPKAGKTVIPLKITTNADGIYKLTMPEIKNIPELYDVWLMDAYRNDSLDIKHNPTYDFNISLADTSTLGTKRFSLVIRQNQAYAYHLLDFNGSRETGAVQLIWKTQNEANYTYFTVERSTDGSNYQVIGSVTATGSGDYSLQDKTPAIGLNRYRLKQEDVNGNITYSSIITVMYAPGSGTSLAGSKISLYPNPTSVNLNVVITPNTTETVSYTITVTNNVGLVMKSFSSAQVNWQGNVSDLPPGTYFVRVVNANDKSVVGKSSFVKL